MTQELTRRWRRTVPEAHQLNLDTRILWMWNQKFGTIQTIFNEGTDEEDRMAATMFLQAILETDLDTIETIFRRIEGTPQTDEEVLSKTEAFRI